MEFTREQKQAIELHNCNILVSAAAGSGKTAVLTERIVDMVCRKEEPVDIDRLLVVTFTNAAAAEMRERISQAILSRLSGEGENEHLQRQAALLHNAQITTIDSFCLFVLRNNFQDIGLDPAFRVADEGELELIRQEVLSELLEERFAAGEEAFYRCVEYYCPNGRERVLEEHILNLCRYALSCPFPEEWLEERKADYRFEELSQIERSEWGRYLLRHLKRTVQALCGDMQRVREICEQPDGPYMYGEIIERELEALSGLAGLDTLSEWESGLSAVTFGRLPSKKDETVSPQKRELAKEVREGVKETLKKVNALYFTQPLCAAIRQAKDCSAAVEELIALCLEFMKKLDGRKREKKLLDFSDIEHFALRILLEKTEDGGIRPTKTALEYRDYFKEILIDEYQDSNLVQEYLLAAVSGAEEESFDRFMVGDVKQSIYKFRLARPELFLEKYRTYSETQGRERRIALHKNFRSRKEVIDTVNTVFSHIMTEELGGIVYDDSAALYPGASYPESLGCESELLLFEKPAKEDEISAKQAEALGICARIRELKQRFQVTDKQTGRLRAVQYRDIVVLLRTGSGWDEEFKSVFAKEGIPAYVEGRTGYFAAQEIRDVLQFLRALDNPLSDIPLFGAMKSVFGGFTDEEAARIKAAAKDKKDSLYDCMKQCVKEEDKGLLLPAALKEKCRHFLEQIARYRVYSSYMTILELLKELMAEYDYPAYVAALPAGSKRLANVEMLMTKAAAFEKNSYYGLFHFIRYMEQLEKYNVDYGEAGTLDENADVVRIMSIHKSKGLEFPVAIVAGLSKRFNMQDAAQALIVDIDLGIGTDYVNPDKRLKCKTLRKNVLATKIKLDSLAEEIRVLYVAMTRAKEKLIMTAVLDNPGETAEKAEGRPVTYTTLTGAGCFLDYLLPVCRDIRVKTLSELAVGDLKEGIEEAGRLSRLSAAAALSDKEALAMLSDRFSYNYPHKNLEKLYTKTTVSELKKAAMEGGEEEPAKELFPQKEIVPYIPSFLREKEEVSGAARGSAMHRIMELLDFKQDYEGVEQVKRAAMLFLQEGRLSQEYADAMIPDKIFCFLKTTLAKRMKAAAEKGRLYREQPFVYGIGAERLSIKEERFPEEEVVLIQGIIDVFFEEEDGLVLLDYKTDVVKDGEELVRRYRVQLDYYEEALRNLTGKKVKERILYSFYLGCEVPA